ncbi:unnamed protein product [Ambrosiozyma monospora]|uniref:Unnamed protein product n=1 Tax=Ambrosiozyma monospora TaxID=43982 RepID=A0ACB5T6N5_AMBMO|nr:unnamed protein product [Ambrosiozyma monospora]
MLLFVFPLGMKLGGFAVGELKDAETDPKFGPAVVAVDDTGIEFEKELEVVVELKEEEIDDDTNWLGLGMGWVFWVC